MTTPAPTSTPIALEVRGMTAAYGGVEVLHDLDLAVEEGEVLGVLGANGAGKTTLLRVLSGLLPPRTGSVWIGGRDETRTSAERLVRRGLAHVPENRLVFPALSVAENLSLGAYTVSRRAEPERELPVVLDLFPRLRERMGQRAGTLSGGEQQMLAIGRALMSRPTVLLLDEPTVGIAPKVVAEIMTALSALRTQRSITMVLVEQNVRSALALADRAVVLGRGRVVLEGTAAELADGDLLQSAYLGG